MAAGGKDSVESVAEAVVEVPEVDLTGGAGGSVYVVQRAGVGSDCATWTDVARVTAPARAKRATILKAAVKGASLLAGKSSSRVTLRVLDVAAAHEHKVGFKSRDPELVIG